MPRAKSNLREEEGKEEEEGGTFAEKGGEGRGASLILEFRPRDSNRFLPFWESNTRPILIAYDDKSFPTCNTLENLSVIHAQ